MVDVKLLSSVGCGNRKHHKKNENIQFIQNSTSEIVLTVFSPTNKCLLTLVWVDFEQMHSIPIEYSCGNRPSDSFSALVFWNWTGEALSSGR